MAPTSAGSDRVSMCDTRLSRLCLVFFPPKKMKHGRPWEKDFYCGKRVLLVGFSLQKILEKIFWRPISSHASCREVVSGIVSPGSIALYFPSLISQRNPSLNSVRSLPSLRCHNPYAHPWYIFLTIGSSSHLHPHLIVMVLVGRPYTFRVLSPNPVVDSVPGTGHRAGFLE